MNLHKIVSPFLNAVQSVEPVIIYKCIGVKNNFGDIVPEYAKPYKTNARFQIDGNETLEHIDNINQISIFRKVYIDTDINRISESIRQENKHNDYIFRVSDSSWWQVSATNDDFSAEGWVCVRAVLQLGKPEFIGNNNE